MAKHVALLRGVNVGGNHRLPMARVREVLDGAGMGPVRTYIQSGNIVLDGDDDPTATAVRVRELLEAAAGFPVPTVVVPAQEFLGMLADCPFVPEVPKLVHVVVLPEPLDDVRRERLLALAAADDSSSDLALGGRAVYLSHPDGLSKSPLANQAMGILRDGTARNLASMAALAGMLA